MKLAILLLFFLAHAHGQYAAYDANDGQYVAIMSSGDVNDFGYNYVINQGRVTMEQKLNMSNTLWLPNILDNVSAIATARDLVSKGYRVIISGTFSHGNAMSVVATEFPNVTFVQYGIKSPLPNLSDLVWSNNEFWFAIGVFCGATSLTDNVGFIHPGLTEGFVSTINAFYSGVKWANSSRNVYTMFSGAFIAADQAQGAADILINEYKVGALTGQQDDLTVPLAAMRAGLLGIGVTGYSLRQLYGEQVGISILRDWSGPLGTYASYAHSTIPNKSDITPNFRTKGQLPDVPSHLVTPEQFTLMTQAIANITGGRSIFYCGDYMSKFGALSNTTNCLLNTSNFNNQLYPDIVNLGYYVVPLTDNEFPRSSFIGLLVITAILLTIPLILAVFVIALKDTRTFKSGSPFFFIVMLIGSAIVYIGVLMWPLDPSTSVCNARIWLPSIGATIAIGALITKNIRIYLLFYNPFKFRAENLSIKNYFPIVVSLFILDTIILIIYSSYGPSGVTVLQGTQGLDKYETRHVCATSDRGNAIIYALLVFHLVQLLCGCILSFMLRNVTSKEFNERKSVAMAIYVVTLCLVIVTALVGVAGVSNLQLIIIVSVALLISNTGMLILIFGSRFVDLYVREVNTAGSVTKGGNSHSTSAKSKTSQEGASKSSKASNDEVSNSGV